MSDMLPTLASQRDTIIMEDHSGRVSLDGAIKAAIHHLVTGVVVAVKGKLNEDGIFIVRQQRHDVVTTTSLINASLTHVGIGVAVQLRATAN